MASRDEFYNDAETLITPVDNGAVAAANAETTFAFVTRMIVPDADGQMTLRLDDMTTDITVQVRQGGVYPFRVCIVRSGPVGCTGFW